MNGKLVRAKSILLCSHCRIHLHVAASFELRSVSNSCSTGCVICLLSICPLMFQINYINVSDDTTYHHLHPMLSSVWLIILWIDFLHIGLHIPCILTAGCLPEGIYHQCLLLLTTIVLCSGSDCYSMDWFSLHSGSRCLHPLPLLLTTIVLCSGSNCYSMDLVLPALWF